MSRQKKDGENRTFKLKKNLVEKLDDYAEKTMLPKTAIVEKALLNFLSKTENEEDKKEN